MIVYRELSDLELHSLIQSGDQAAFTEIYDRYWSVLYLHARHMLNNQDYASDVVQEVFVGVWNKKSQIDLSVSLKAYLYRSTRNRVLNMVRSGKMDGDYKNHLLRIYEDKEYTTDDQVRYNELRNLIEKEVTLLPKKMREVFELSRSQNLSHSEIAALLEISDATVKKQISRAIHILRKKLNLPASVIVLYLTTR